MLHNFQQAWRFTFQSWRMALFVHVLLLMTVLPIGMQLYHVLGASIGHSLSLEKLLLDYNHTVFMDMINVHGASISPLLGQLRWVLPMYLLVAVLVHAGLMYMVVMQEGSWKIFWKGVAYYFFSFLKIALVFITILVISLVIIWMPFIVYIVNINEWLVDETGLVWLFYGTVIVSFCWFIILFIWSVLTRSIKIKGPEHSIFKSIKSGWKSLRQNFFSYLGQYILISLPFLLFWTFYYYLNAISGMVSSTLVWVFIILQQLYIFFRVCLRIALFHGITFLEEK
ncbi:MAG: hypothetical protein KDC24_15100 [Saprospiraceae bacterium]|nr:hypothetical protein [Saprospiraceae bacterium]